MRRVKVQTFAPHIIAPMGMPGEYTLQDIAQ
jgi:hypothetical protein